MLGGRSRKGSMDVGVKLIPRGGDAPHVLVEQEDTKWNDARI